MEFMYKILIDDKIPDDSEVAIEFSIPSTSKLESQFRCNGSEGYLSWLTNIMEIKETANYDRFNFDFDSRVIDDVNELKK